MNQKLISTYSNEELDNFILNNHIKLQFSKEFKDRYKIAYSELYDETKDWSDEDWQDESPIREDALKVILNYFKKFKEQLNLGHSEDWARLYAESSDINESSELDETIIYHNYKYFNKINKDLAKKELIIIAKNIKNEQHVIDYYLDLFAFGDGYNEPIERTKKYADIFDEEIKKNKSKIFANRYADLVSSGTYHNQYCHYFASKYEELILEGKHENYAGEYSEKYSELLTNIVLRREIHEEDFQLIKNNVDDYMKKL
jgi:hypothetical protein